MTIEGVDSFEDSSGRLRARARPGENLHPRRKRRFLALHRLSRAGLHGRRHRQRRVQAPSCCVSSTLRSSRPLRCSTTTLETRERELKKQYEVKGGYDASQYQSERIFAKAPDGVEVPISLVYRRGFEKQRPRPAAALRLWRVRPQHRSGIFFRSPEPARSRLRLRHRASSAAAPNWAKNGTTRASCSPRRTPSPISSPAPSI